MTGLIDAAGEFISDAIAAGLELLAQGLVHILRWIMQAANTVFATVSYAIPDFTEQIAQLGAQVESYNQFCARSEFTFKITRAAADRAAPVGCAPGSPKKGAPAPAPVRVLRHGP